VDPRLPDLGSGGSPIVAYIGSLSRTLGADLLIDAVRSARGRVPNCRLRLISPAPPEAVSDLAAESEFVEWRPAGLPQLAEALADVRVCVIPFRIGPYTNLAVPLKLFDYLGYGKPIVATECTETARILAPTEAGILVTDTSAALADAIVRVLTDDDLANRLAHRARALAQAPGMSWDARAQTVLTSLLPGASR
jgi:glycosyltransferase involved in cell wall biosynthesis